ncbi:MAG: hypothetical protein ACKOXM_01935 [Agromyces sp.]
MSEFDAADAQRLRERSMTGRRLNLLLCVLLGIEALALWGSVGWLALEIASAPADSIRTAIALTVLAGIVAIWVTATTVAIFRVRRWARGSAITWQVLQVAVAVGASQGEHPNWLVSLGFSAPAVVVVLLAVSCSVRAEYGALDADRT